MLFSTINWLLSPLDAPQPSGTPALCFKFLDFFQEKVATIHQQLPLFASPSALSLSSFSPVDSISVAKLVSVRDQSGKAQEHKV